jgi:hypothetical protein
VTRAHVPRQVSSLGLGILWQGFDIGTVLKSAITGEDEDAVSFANPMVTEHADDAESNSVKWSSTTGLFIIKNIIIIIIITTIIITTIIIIVIVIITITITIIIIKNSHAVVLDDAS